MRQIYLQMLHSDLLGFSPWGVLDLSLGRGVPPGPWNPDPVYDKKFVKISKNWYPVYDFQVKFDSFFVKMRDF